MTFTVSCRVYKHFKWLILKSRPLGALAIKYEFDQHNDTCFQSLWPHGSPEPLTVKSENSGFWRNCYTGCPKIMCLEDKNDFVTLEMWTFALALIKLQNCHLLESFSTKKPWKNIEICSPPICNKITMKMYKWQKMGILCFGQRKTQWSHFQCPKIIYIFPRPNFRTPCISVSP